MGSAHERCRLELQPLDREPPGVRAELLRIAQALERRRCRSVGLLPAGPEVTVFAVAVQLGRAMAEVTGAPFAVVDGTRALDGAAACGSAAPAPGAAEEAGFRTTWIANEVAALAPPAAGPGVMLRALSALLNVGVRPFGGVIVDLTGLDRTGEHLDAIALLDGVAVVGRGGRTRTWQLDRWARALAAEKNLGVLLVGV